jgi:NADPH:quinone reductase-like Zn-dependent oxidoreductase
MKAAILHDFKKPLSIEEVERPRPEADEVLIQVEACGACHSDLHVADGDWTQVAGIVKRPLILGHEIAGHVVEKGPEVFQGLQRLRALCENWLAYGEQGVFPGGCFFSAASLEFDDRPGRVREQIVGLMRKWLGSLEQAARDAQSAGEIMKAADASQLAFEIQALAMGANWSSRLFRDASIFRSVRSAILRRIEQVTEATPTR